MDRPSLTPFRRFLARQPILDVDANVKAYELLFRNATGGFGNVDGTSATAQVMASGLMAFGLERLTGGQPAFINLTEGVIERDLLRLFSPDQVVGEILEDIEPEPHVIDACRSLRRDGYRIALDDVVDSERIAAFRDVVDLVKVDFMDSSIEAQEALGRELERLGIEALAEKVETHEDVRRAKEAGYTLFQGYYFAKPEVLSARGLPPSKLQYIRLLAEFQRPQLDLASVEDIIRADITLSYRLLRFINSSAFGLRIEVNSIGRALRLLGPGKVRRWATLVSLGCMADDKPRELMTTGLIRARFCELLASAAGMQSKSDDVFLVGLFSVLDALMDVSLAELLQRIALSSEIERALAHQEGAMGTVFSLVRHYEAAEWDAVSELAATLSIDETAIANAYFEALAFAQVLWNPSEAAT